MPTGFEHLMINVLFYLCLRLNLYEYENTFLTKLFIDFRVKTMSAKRKTYTIKEKLGIIDRVKRGDSKSSLFREFGVPEGTIRGWMKEEDKLRSFVDQVDDKIGLDRKKARLSAAGDVDECLFT